MEKILIVYKDDPDVVLEIKEFLLDLDKVITRHLQIYMLDTTVFESLHLDNISILKDFDFQSHFDLVLAIGGDGTVLQAAWQFQQNTAPPIVPVYMKGTLGFLTVCDIDTCRSFLSKNRPMIISERSRLSCSLRAKGSPMGSPSCSFHVLNEITVEKGLSGGLLKLSLCTQRENLISSISADGLIIATPTGSTAYSMSAGGPIIHPEVNAMLITPICPHSLSFRPILLPYDEVAFDGRERLELRKGEQVIVGRSPYSVPMVTPLCDRTNQTIDWFETLSARLHWNDDVSKLRIEQISKPSAKSCGH